jgi:hypothetical protein
MKRIITAAILFLMYINLNAQSISLLGYGGAITGSRVFPLANEARVKGDWSYGAGLEFGLPFGAVTLTWSGQSTIFENHGLLGGTYTEVNINSNYYQLGFQKDLSEGAVRPHTIFSLGAAQFSPQGNTTQSDEWFFAATFGLGLKADLNDRVGLRIQAKANMPLEMGGLGIFCSTGGCSPNIYFNPILFQGEFTAGLAIKIK